VLSPAGGRQPLPSLLKRSLQTAGVGPYSEFQSLPQVVDGVHVAAYAFYSRQQNLVGTGSNMTAPRRAFEAGTQLVGGSRGQEGGASAGSVAKEGTWMVRGGSKHPT
jgi:hypothetical protein